MTDKTIAKNHDKKGTTNPNKGNNIPKIIIKGIAGKINILEIKETKEK